MVFAQELGPGGNGLLALEIFPRLHCPRMHEVPECLLVCHVGASELCLGAVRQVGFVWISLSIPCCSMKPPVLWSLRYYSTCQLTS